MDDQVKGKGGRAGKTPAQATQPTTQNDEVTPMADQPTTFKLVNDQNGLPVNYEMVDATVRNHKVKVVGDDGKPTLREVPKEKMVIKVTLPDGTVVERPRYARLVAIPRITGAKPTNKQELLAAISDLYDQIDLYDSCDRVEAPDQPNGAKPANVKRVALIGSQPGGEKHMETPDYLWSAVCGAVRLDTQQNGQGVMRKRINVEIPAEMGWAVPAGRKRSTKVETTTPDRFTQMAGGEDN